MDRRVFLVSALAGLTLPRAVAAQSATTVPHIGLLSPFSPSVTAPWHEAFRLGLRDLGWVDGTNIRIEYRFADGRHDRLPGLVAELMRLKVNVIVTAVTEDALTAKKATIPVVMASAGDPLVTGLVETAREAAPQFPIVFVTPDDPAVHREAASVDGL